MKYILAFLIVAGLFPALTHAASPDAQLVKSKDGTTATLTFSNLQSVSKVSYVLTYDYNRRQTGVEGGFATSRYSSRSSRRQLIGTCSTRRCVYHKTAKNFQLTVTYKLRAGGSTTVTKSLP